MVVIISAKKKSAGWVDEWTGGGSKSRINDCLYQSKTALQSKAILLKWMLINKSVNKHKQRIQGGYAESQDQSSS